MKKYFSWFIVVALASICVFFTLRQASLKQRNKKLQQELVALDQSVALRDSLIALDAWLLDRIGTDEAMERLMQFSEQNTDSILAVGLAFRIAYLETVAELAQSDNDLVRSKDVQIARLKQANATLEAAVGEQLDQAEQALDSVKSLNQRLEGKLAKAQRELALKEKVKVISFAGLKGATVHYMGEVVDGKANGGGIGIWTTGSVYRGEWRSNLRHGKGSFQWKDGERYEGNYVDGKREGEGTYYWPSGERYEGQWVADQRTGQGTLFDLDGNVRYKGEWLNDVPATTK